MKTIKYGVKIFDPNRARPFEWCDCWLEGYAALKLKTEYTTHDINAAHNYLNYFQRYHPDFNYWVEEKP